MRYTEAGLDTVPHFCPDSGLGTVYWGHVVNFPEFINALLLALPVSQIRGRIHFCLHTFFRSHWTQADVAAT
jgi:hypothetical protein